MKAAYAITLAVLSTVSGFMIGYQYGYQLGYIVGSGRSPGEVWILSAGSLTNIISSASEEFMKRHPTVAVRYSPAGSLECIQKLKAGAACDIIAVSDWDAIAKELLNVPIPGKNYCYADWLILFACNEMVIAVPKGNPAGINSTNWYEAILNPLLVKRWGRANPDSDPCGYRTLMMFKLAELYYSVPGLANRLENQTVNLVMKPKEYDLMADVAAGALDLAFTYKSLALQFKVDYVALPPQINLGNVEYEDLYNKAEVFAMGKKRTGTTIMYALTIPNLARNKDWATRFILFLLGDEGREILRENFQDPIVPPTARGDLMSMPDELRKICEVK